MKLNYNLKLPFIEKFLEKIFVIISAGRWDGAVEFLLINGGCLRQLQEANFEIKKSCLSKAKNPIQLRLCAAIN